MPGDTETPQAAADRLDRVNFMLSAEEFQQFMDILERPAAPNPGLDRLMAVRAPWDHPRV